MRRHRCQKGKKTKKNLKRESEMAGSDEAPQMPKAPKHEDDNHGLELVRRHANQALDTAGGKGQMVV
jgi:hypothetical protein